MPNLTGFLGKVAVVTDTNRLEGTGRAIALTLAAAGCDVIVTSSHTPNDDIPNDESSTWRGAESLAAELRDLGHRALAVNCDVAVPESVDALEALVIGSYGGVDLVVNNVEACTGIDGHATVDLPLDSWEQVTSVHLRGPFLMSRRFGRRLVMQGKGGVIVNISSVAAKLLLPTTGAYSASNAGLQALTTSMAIELAPFRVRVNAVRKGLALTSDAPVYVTGVAATVAYLCSQEGSWITGQCIDVDGGATAQR